MILEVPEHIARRLTRLAELKGVSVGDYLERLMDQSEAEPPPGSLAQLAKLAQEANLASEHTVDTAERSREILNTEYADYLKDRMDTDADYHG